MATPRPEWTRAMNESSNSNGLPTGPTTAIALVVAVFAAVGVTGDLVPRMVRDQPGQVRFILWTAILGAAVIALVALQRARSKQRDVAKPAGRTVGFHGVIGSIGVLAAISWSVYLGTESVGKRESPRVVISATTGQNRIVTISVEVSASGLTLRDDMRVQIVGLTTTPTLLNASRNLCEQQTDPAKVAW
jgi:hypothetical protein